MTPADEVPSPLPPAPEPPPGWTCAAKPHLRSHPPVTLEWPNPSQVQLLLRFVLTVPPGQVEALLPAGGQDELLQAAARDLIDDEAVLRYRALAGELAAAVEEERQARAEEAELESERERLLADPRAGVARRLAEVGEALGRRLVVAAHEVKLLQGAVSKAHRTAAGRAAAAFNRQRGRLHTENDEATEAQLAEVAALLGDQLTRLAVLLRRREALMATSYQYDAHVERLLAAE